MLDTHILISPHLSFDAIANAGTDQSFSVYLHRHTGSTRVSINTLYEQDISTIAFPNDLLDHASYIFESISSIADIDFHIVHNPSDANLLFYVDTIIETSSDSSVTLGITLTHRDPSVDRVWTEIYLNGPLIVDSTNHLDAYVFNHELLHALGLEHPFDDSDGDFYLSTDPYLSATPEETTMSYITPQSNLYPEDISSLDYDALVDIWGPAQDTAKIDSELSVYRLFNPSSGIHLFSRFRQRLIFLLAIYLRFLLSMRELHLLFSQVLILTFIVILTLLLALTCMEPVYMNVIF